MESTASFLQPAAKRNTQATTRSTILVALIRRSPLDLGCGSDAPCHGKPLQHALSRRWSRLFPSSHVEDPLIFGPGPAASQGGEAGIAGGQVADHRRAQDPEEGL